jgi:hypothetical protein
MSLMIACERKGRAMACFLRGCTLALCVIALATGTTALAQDSTPTGSTPACVDVATPDVDTVMAEAYGSGTVPGTPPAETLVAVEELPQGQPADAETVATVDQVVQTWVACYLSGESLAALALQSDQMDQVFYGVYGQDQDVFEDRLEADVQATPHPLDPQTVISVGKDVRVLDDGRIGGIWSVDGDAAFIILVQEDGSWVVDDVMDIIDE